MKRLLNWLSRRFSPDAPPPAAAALRRSGVHSAPARPAPARRRAQGARTVPAAKSASPAGEPRFEGRIEDNGPGKNVLIRNRYVREDTGTHDTLKILDDSLLETDEEAGIDPYNTGQFDRSKHWDRRFRD